SLAAKELRQEKSDLPPFVSIAPQRFLAENAFGPGFLGPQYAALLVADGQRAAAGNAAAVDQQLRVQNLSLPGVTPRQAEQRLDILHDLETEVLGARPGPVVDSHRAAYAAAVRLLKPQTAQT